mmetsp:Transcript_104612/g.239783  ORF Transcript_104612/g.239783 Transcript_104612/m.239783 type:complete len:735 (-) Transcript_104612:2310-4514(-)
MPVPPGHALGRHGGLDFVDGLRRNIDKYLGKVDSAERDIVERLGGHLWYVRESRREGSQIWQDALRADLGGRPPGEDAENPRVFGSPPHSTTVRWPAPPFLARSDAVLQGCGAGDVHGGDLVDMSDCSPSPCRVEEDPGTPRGWGAEVKPQPIPMDVPDELLTVRFSSCFEGGNLMYAVYQPEEDAFDLVLDHDLHTMGHTQWFYFGVTGVPAGRSLTFRLVNMCKSDSLYSRGMRPWVFSEAGAAREVPSVDQPPDGSLYTNLEDSKWWEAESLSCGWRPGCSDIDYSRNGIPRASRDNESDEDEEGGRRSRRAPHFYTLRFTHRWCRDRDSVFFAHCFPYTYSMLRTLLAQIERHPSKSKYMRRERLCKTEGGVECDLLTITDWGETRSRKRICVASARVHPGESNSSWLMHGLLNFLLSTNPEAHVLRQNFVWKIVPMLNPDGVIIGNYRCGLAGVDLNRQWRQPSAVLHRSIHELKRLLAKLKARSEVALYIDLHGHSRKLNAFSYACGGGREDSRFYRARLYPRIMAMVCPAFQFDQCRWKVGKGKRGTGRVVASLDLGLTAVYTVETSFFGMLLDDKGKATESPSGTLMVLTTRRLQLLGASLSRAVLFLNNLTGDVQTAIREFQRTKAPRGTPKPLCDPAEADAHSTAKRGPPGRERRRTSGRRPGRHWTLHPRIVQMESLALRRFVGRLPRRRMRMTRRPPPARGGRARERGSCLKCGPSLRPRQG